MSFIAELKRRNVLRAAAFYLAAVWALAQGIAQLGPSFGMPEWGTRWFVIAAVIGFPFWIAFAWFYEFTPQGLKRESEIDRSDSISHRTGRKLDFAIIGVLAIAVVLLLTDRFVLRQGVNEQAAIAVPEKSIAVLPFANLSSDKEQEYFSDGISEDLLNLLTKIPQLQVTARTSSFSFKGKDIAIPEIARRLRVAHVLVGSVRKAGNTVRISAQLVDAATDTQLWSQSWDRKLDDVFAIQDEIAADVVKQLKVELLGEVPTVKPMDPKAYPLILQAQALLDQGSAPGRAQSIVVFQQALAIAPNEARAWASLGRAYFNQALFGERAATEGARLAKEAGNKTLEIEPGNASALALLGRIAADFEFDLPTAARYYQRALELEPGNLMAVNAAGILLMNIGRTDQALELLEYRVVHDPANPAAYNNLGNCRYVARRWNAAIDAWRTALRLSPDYSGSHYAIGSVLLLGKHDAAGALKEMQAEPDELSRMLGLPNALHAMGRTKEADAALQAFIDKYGKEQPEAVATVYAYRGQVDAAFEWLDKAVAIGDPVLAQAMTEPLFDSLHGDPRWTTFLRKIGYAPEQLAKIQFKVTLPEAAKP